MVCPEVVVHKLNSRTICIRRRRRRPLEFDFCPIGGALQVAEAVLPWRLLMDVPGRGARLRSAGAGAGALEPNR